MGQGGRVPRLCHEPLTGPAAQFVAELLELAASCHLAGQLVQADAVPGVAVGRHTAFEQHEVVADQVGVVRVWVMRTTPETLVTDRGDALQHGLT